MLNEFSAVLLTSNPFLLKMSHQRTKKGEMLVVSGGDLSRKNMSEERLPNAMREANQNANNKTRAIIKVIRANMYFPATHAPK